METRTVKASELRQGMVIKGFSGGLSEVFADPKPYVSSDGKENPDLLWISTEHGTMLAMDDHDFRVVDRTT